MIKTSIIKNYLKELPTNYLICDIKFTKKEIDYLENFNIINGNSFNYYGNIDDLDDIELNEFINNVGNNENIDIFNNIIHKLGNNVTKAYNTKFCWLTIRITIPTTDYDIPRWHIDGNFFTDSNNNQAKFISSLKGPGTLFIKNRKSKKINNIYEEDSKQNLEEYKKLNIFSYNEEIENNSRKRLAIKYKDIKQYQLKTREGLIFLNLKTMSDLKKNPGLLHSEPKKDVTRIFISILPGTEENIINFKKRREQK